jgi:hypothetical protein
MGLIRQPHIFLVLPHYIMKLAESWQQKSELLSQGMSGKSIIVDSY